MQLNQLYGSKQRPSWLIIGGVVLGVGLVVAILGDWLLGWHITGLFRYTLQTTTSNETGVETTAVTYPGKTLWDLVDLLLIPIVLGGGIFFLAWTHRQTQMALAADQQAQKDVLAERATAQAVQQTRDNIQAAELERYVALLTDLLLQGGLRRAKPDSDVAQVARLHTLTLLPGLNPAGRAKVLRFLYEAGLILVEETVIRLAGANLAQADLGQFNLAKANLQGANLFRANLTKANLTGAYLEGANLIEANLTETELDGATYDQQTAWPTGFDPEHSYLDQHNIEAASH